MRYRKFSLYRQAETGTDALGNGIMESEHIGDFYGLISGWTREDIDLLGREITASSRKIVTRENSLKIKEGDSVTIEGTSYEVNLIKDVDRWRVLYLKGYRV